MKSVKIMFVVVAVLVAMSAYAEGLSAIPVSARSLGMGATSVANPDGAWTWWQNPGALGVQNGQAKEGSRWAWDVAGSYSESNDILGSAKIKTWDAAVGGYDAAEGMGFGAGYSENKIDPVKLKRFGAGFGMKLRSDTLPGLAWGVSVENAKLDTPGPSPSKTLFNAGLLYTVPVAEGKAVKLGLVCNDISDELANLNFNTAVVNPAQIGDGLGALVGRTWSMGLSLPVSDKLTLAVDNRGIGQVLHIWSAGLEWKDNSGWALRCGDWDGSLTVGAGYRGTNWFLDAAYADAPTNKIVGLVSGGSAPSANFWALTAGCNF